MPRNEAKRQKKLMKRRQKTKVRRKERINPYSAEGIRLRIRNAGQLPVHECLVNPNWRESGLAEILLSRLQPDENLTVGVYLVDLLCLGLKNTLFRTDMSVTRYQTKVLTPMYEEAGCQDCSVSLAQRIVYGAIDYAARFHFRPNRDFRQSHYILGDPRAVGPRKEVEFGRRGRPLYISGPHDDVAQVVAQLTAHVGPDGFDFMVGEELSVPAIQAYH
jgi:hypothetical protein